MGETQLKRRDDSQMQDVRTRFNNFLDLVVERGRSAKYDLGDLARIGRQTEMRGSLSQVVPQIREHQIPPIAMDNALALAVTLDQSRDRGSIGDSLENWGRRGRI